MPNIAPASAATAVASASASTSSQPSGLGAVVASISVVEDLQTQTGAKFAEVMGPGGAGDGMTAANLVALQTLSAELDTTTLGLASTSAVYRDSEKNVVNKF
jgi:hypothetical protein